MFNQTILKIHAVLACWLNHWRFKDLPTTSYKNVTLSTGGPMSCYHNCPNVLHPLPITGFVMDTNKQVCQCVSSMDESNLVFDPQGQGVQPTWMYLFKCVDYVHLVVQNYVKSPNSDLHVVP